MKRDLIGLASLALIAMQKRNRGGANLDLMSENELKDLIMDSEIWVLEGFGVVLNKDDRMIFVTPDYSKILYSKLAKEYPNDPHLPKFKYHGQVNYFPHGKWKPGSPFVVSSLLPLDNIELDWLYVFSAPVYKTSDLNPDEWERAVEPYLLDDDFTFAKLLPRHALVRETIIPKSDSTIPKSILDSLSKIVDVAKRENSDVVWDSVIEDNILVDGNGNLILNDLMIPNLEYSNSFSALAEKV